MEITLEERNYFNQLDERQQRLYVGLKAKLLGYHGVRLVSIAYNVNIKTVRKGKSELSDLPFLTVGGSLKCGANFLYYWTYRAKNDFKTEQTSVTCLLPNKIQVIVKSNLVVCQFSEYFLVLEGDG